MRFAPKKSLRESSRGSCSWWEFLVPSRLAVDCTPLQTESNLSSWSTLWDLTNQSIWNGSANPTNLDRGYEINQQLVLGSEYGNDTSPILARERTILCCANASSSGSSAIGYWSNDYTPGQVYDFQPNWEYPRNFTMKWVTGNAAPSDYLMNQTYSAGWLGEAVDYRHLIFSQPPRLSALSCRSRIETTDATITVDMATGHVYEYTILNTPNTTHYPWTDVYQSHDQTGDMDSGYSTKMDVSYGVLFQDALMYASDLQIFWPDGGSQDGDSKTKDLHDTNFNFRLPDHGLNADLMSYSMYKLAGGDLDTLTNPTQMQELGTKVFSTFFQHFVSSNITNGGWGYQPIGTTANNTPAPADTTTTAHVSIAVEVLQMSPVAVYISLSILFILMCITVFVHLAGYKNFKNLRHDFDDLASVIAVVYDSEKLRQWVREHPDEKEWSKKMLRRGDEGPNVRLGTFVGSDGQETWGVEIVEEEEEKEGGEEGSMDAASSKRSHDRRLRVGI